MKQNMGTIKEDFTQFIYNLQDSICRELESVDGKALFKEDTWIREGGGGGRTRVISGGDIFEKGGVNVSAVHGELSGDIKKQLSGKHKANRLNGSESGEKKADGDASREHDAGQTRQWFYATGLSLVLHPESPIVPTVHANFRYFELYDDEQMNNPVDAWFGGGSDMTPYYLRKEDVVHFHQTLKTACDNHGPDLYPRFKMACDDYFHNSHRGEARGIGGIFFDYLRGEEQESGGEPGRSEGQDGPGELKPGETGWGEPRGQSNYRSLNDWKKFTEEAGSAFTDSYIPIVHRRMGEAFDDNNRYWQEIRRGRYVEFNLIHDRGTLFGLRSGGRVESILMSLPPRVRWDYDYSPTKGSPEEELLEVLKNPADWVEFDEFSSRH